MLPLLRGPAGLLILAAVAAIGLLVALGPLLARSTLAPAALMLMSLLAGAALAYGIEFARLRPSERYRRKHTPLAGPRPGARL